MDIVQQLKEAFGNLTAAKLRTLLAILGILIGVASVVAMVTCGEMATQKALDQFKTLGTNLMSATFYSSSGATTDANKFTLKDAYNLKQEIPSIKLLAPYTTTFSAINYQGKKVNGSTIGATENLQKILHLHILQGRFISNLDNYEPYAVIGANVYKTIQKTGVTDAVGKQIQVGSTIFTIIGVAKPWPESQFFNQSINNSVIVPIKTSFVLSKYTSINNMVMAMEKNYDIDKATTKIKSYIQKSRKGAQAYVRSAKKLIASMESQNEIYTLLLGLIGGISLLVGGIGVMNIMLVSVSERRKEIGIRMAIGARRRDIQLLFITEAMILALFGGTMGVIIGIGTALAIAYFANWDFHIFWLPPFIGFAVSAATGIFFGFYPAYRASQLDPIQTLRSD